MFLINLKKEKEVAKRKREKIPPILLIPIERLRLGKRTLNALTKNDISFVGELCELGESEILAMNGIGKVCLEEIKAELWRIDNLVPPMAIKKTFRGFARKCKRLKEKAS